MGREFAIQVFKSVNEFVSAVFETLLALYDPNIEGFLEEAERDLDRLALTRTVFGQTYYVLIVLSRVMNKDKDKDLRLRVQALAGVSPQDFGVDDYLLLNKEAPMMKMVKTQSDDFVRMSQQMMRKSVLRSSTQTNPKNFLPKFSSVYKSRDSTLSSDSTVFEKADDSRGSLSAEVILEDEDEYLHRQSTANVGRRNTEGTQRGPSMVIRTSDSIVDDAEQFQEENKVNSHDSNPASLNDTIDVGVR